MEKKLSESSESLIDNTLSVTPIAPGEIIIGTFIGFDVNAQPLIDFAGNPENNPLRALTTQALTSNHVGRQVALLFANAELTNPVIMGVIHSPLQDMLENYQHPVDDLEKKEKPDSPLQADDVIIDGKRIVLEAKDEIVLRCGEASITLTKAGKVLIRGKYLLNRSTGVNRIMGGSVQVN